MAKLTKRVRFVLRESGPLPDAVMEIIRKYGYWPGPCPDCGVRPGQWHGPDCPGPKPPWLGRRILTACEGNHP